MGRIAVLTLNRPAARNSLSEGMIGEPPASSGDERYADYARDIRQSGHHLLNLINDILDLAKIEAGRLELDERILDLDDIAQRAIGFVKPQAAGTMVHIETDLAFHGMFVGDERGITQLLINLLQRWKTAQGSI